MDKRFKLFAEVLKSLLVLLFVYTATSKLIDYPLFRGTLSQSPLLYQASGVIAIVLPVAELLIALLLVTPTTVKIGFQASFVLISLFSLYIAYMLITQNKLPCSCGGVLSIMTWKQHLVFNFAFMVIAFLGVYIQDENDIFQPINSKLLDNRFAQTGQAENLQKE